jgi:RNase P/RNase MRP subunit p30
LGSDPLVHALRHTSLLLDQRSNQLEIVKNAVDARELRRLAKRLRKQVRLIETSPLQNHINRP